MISRIFFAAIGLSCIFISTKIFIDGTFFSAKYGIEIQLGDEKNIVAIGLAIAGIYIVTISIFTGRK